MKTTEERIEAVIGKAAVATIPQVVEIFGLGGTAAVQSMRNKIARGMIGLNPFKLGGKEWYFSASEIADFIDRRGRFAPGYVPDPAAAPGPLDRTRGTNAGSRVKVGRPTNAERARRLSFVVETVGSRLCNAMELWLLQHVSDEEAALRAAIDPSIEMPGGNARRPL